MVIIEGTDESKRGERERWMAPEVSKAVLIPKIINCEKVRKALEKGALEEEQSRAISSAVEGIEINPHFA